MLSISHGCDAIDHEAQVTESLQAMQDQWQPLGTMCLHSFAIRHDNKKMYFFLSDSVHLRKELPRAF